MATAKSTEIETPSRPLIQIDNLIREMNDEEFAIYEQTISSIPPMPGPAEA